ncbi:sulfotransferase family protein [Paroceanicella profunda]|uniref:sulfotransferase family protein n=1 Tax=Paroceanicella profunda TaxID=2579971 RepID=UPI001478BE7A|nr:sulfotransferase [Paroceanicella profunda]
MQDIQATVLFGIGAQKAGTTWLHDWFATNPAVHVSPVKEAHYFDALLHPGERGHVTLRARQLEDIAKRLRTAGGPKHFANLHGQAERMVKLLSIHAGDPESDSAYLDWLFADHRGQPVVTDITPSYATLDRAGFARMAAVAPRTRFLFVLRDPVERLWSAMRMTGAREAEARGTDFASTVRRWYDAVLAGEQPRQSERSDYLRTLTELEAAVPAGHSLTVFFEDLFTPETLGRITAFLGLPAHPGGAVAPSNAGRRLEIDTERRAAGVAALAADYTFIAERFGDALPAAWRRQMAYLPARAEV